MLFYNHKQEFIGIDEEGLKLLNYGTFEELLGVCSDVADLFAKEPGYIHNFKSFGWIDFLLHADSDTRTAIVHGNGRTFSCTLQVQKLYLADAPGQNGYIIDMVHIKSISGDEIRAVAPSVPKAPVSFPPFDKIPAPAPEPFAAPSVLPESSYVEPTALNEPGTFDVPTFEEETYVPAPIETEELYEAPSSAPAGEKVYFTPPEEIHAPEPVAVPPQPSAPSGEGIRYSEAEKEFLKNLKVGSDYRFDPTVAANELGLPVDLIEEFIGDFIQQSHDFRSDLFEALLKGDMNNLKILSHKLKGVAANLRIEDAFESLAVVNTSSDPVEIEANLKHFYAIIGKLEGKPIAEMLNGAATAAPAADIGTPPAAVAAQPSAAADDIYEFVLKEAPAEPLTVKLDELFPDETSYAAPSYEDAPISEESFDTYLEHDFALEQEPEAPPTILPEEEIAEEILPEPVESLYAPFVESAAKCADETPSETETAVLHYDKRAIAASLGIDMAFLDELIEDYKNEAATCGSAIATSVAAFDTLGWKKAAVRLKGITDNLRMSEISEELAIIVSTNDAQEAHKASKRLSGYIAQL